MRHISYEIVKSRKLSHTELQEVVELHQSVFNLNRSFIIKNLLMNQKILLYRDSKTKQLIGTIGVCWVRFQWNLVCHLSSIVISRDHQNHGLLLHGMSILLRYTVLRYPFLNKYATGLVTTKMAMQWISKFNGLWPNRMKRTPKEFINIQQQLINNLFSNDQFFLKNGAYYSNRLITNSLRYKSGSDGYSLISAKSQMMAIMKVGVVTFIPLLVFAFKRKMSALFSEKMFS